MEDWNGKDRRLMNQDQIERDRLLTEVHSDMKHLVSWSQKHDKNDDDRFEAISHDIEWGKKIIWMAVGIVIFIEFMSRLIK